VGEIGEQRCDLKRCRKQIVKYAEEDISTYQFAIMDIPEIRKY